MYDVERFGILHAGNPKQADILVVTGSVNFKNAPVLRQIYAQMREPRVVLALGVCSSSGGVFAGSYNVFGGVDKVLPVDVFVPGCPPRPEAIIDGFLLAVKKLDERHLGLDSHAPEKEPIVFRKGRGEIVHDAAV
jgi:ech hydrogenase subunit C